MGSKGRSTAHQGLRYRARKKKQKLSRHRRRMKRAKHSKKG